MVPSGTKAVILWLNVGLMRMTGINVRGAVMKGKCFTERVRKLGGPCAPLLTSVPDDIDGDTLR
jgi:hypothetical protein